MSSVLLSMSSLSQLATWIAEQSDAMRDEERLALWDHWGYDCVCLSCCLVSLRRLELSLSGSKGEGVSRQRYQLPAPAKLDCDGKETWLESFWTLPRSI